MKLIRVFPRRTNATPDDELAYIGLPYLWSEADRVDISVTFTYDLPMVDQLVKEWSQVAPVTVGGPALDDIGGEFEPGKYLKRGYTITSRGCPNKCWFCSVWKREGDIRELEIKDGYDVLDSNILACSDKHVSNVFDMLDRQEHRIKFTGGLEAKILKPWHCDRLARMKIERAYFAYDTPDDYEPLVQAGKMLRSAGFKTSAHTLSCYVLIGFKGDTFEKAEARLRDTWQAGFVPYGMLYKDKDGSADKDWKQFQRQWCRPIIAMANLKLNNRPQEAII